MSGTGTLVVGMFGGGLAGALATQVIQACLAKRKAPKLALRFGEEVPGCVVPNVTYVDHEGLPAGRRKHIRIRIDNTGRSAATDVEVLVERISSGAQWQFQDDVMNAIWSNSNDSTKVSIPSQTHRFVDLFAANNDPMKKGLILNAAGGNIERLRNVEVEGTIEIDVCVTASNTSTVKRTLKIASNGSASGLRIIMGQNT